MAIYTHTVTKVTCDLCGNECKKDDGVIAFPINGGDGRDVGPTEIRGAIRLYQPYGVSDGILCKQCLHKCLSILIKKHGYAGGIT